MMTSTVPNDVGGLLPSWNDTPTTVHVLDFVRAVTDPESPAYVPPVKRIAVFDNDGTLWVEYPMIVQVQFALDRFRGVAARHPELATSEALQAVAAGDPSALAVMEYRDLEAVLFATHAGQTQDELNAAIDAWLEHARHPELGRPVIESIYQPMLELLELLRINAFTSFIVTGGGSDFVRRFAHTAFGIPPHQVIGSSIAMEYRFENGHVTLDKLPHLRSFNDRTEKVVNIAHHIGQRPILVGGNSDGDLAMFRYAASGPGPSLRLLIHHDDADREAAYDRDFPLSPLREALDVTEEEQILRISMRDDWRRIFR
jgi:phosphoglycolate phosphatase-like HAD superfamily hydrolase